MSRSGIVPSGDGNLIYVNSGRRGFRHGCAMPVFLYRCPHTGLNVQGWSADQPGEEDSAFEPVTCTACTRVHLVDPKTGRVLGAGDE